MKRGGSEWTPIYMLVVLVIAAVLIMTLIKPLFRRAAASTEESAETVATVAGAALFLGQCIIRKL